MAAIGGATCHRELLPFAALTAMECSRVGINTLFKLATRAGMSSHVYIVYAYALAALCLLPFPFFSVKSRSLPPLNSSILLKIFFLGVVGYASQIMGYTGINYASPTLASAISNLTPAFTFVLAVIFRMERVVLSSTGSRAKIVGTIVSISGAFIVAFYKGPGIKSNVPLHPTLHSPQSNWIVGSLFLTVEYLLVPLWYIIQTHIMKVYPAELTIVCFYTSTVSLLAAVVGFFAEPDSSKWRIRPDITLASILCCGVFGCCIQNAVDAWALHFRGPVYVAMFKPLSIVIAAVMGVIFLGDKLYLGSIIGATVIVIGFYAVMWGKAKEDLSDLDETTDLETSASEKYPLLQSYRTQATQRS